MIENNVKKSDTTFVQKELIKDSVFKLSKVNKEKSESNESKWWKNKLDDLNESVKKFGSYEIKKRIKINDTLTSVIFVLNDGVCSKSYIGTYLNEKEIEFMEVALGCDHDLSFPEYNWKEYNFISKKSFKVKDYVEKVHDSLVNSKGYLLDGIDFIEAETEIDSTEKIYKIYPDGTINRIKD